MYQFGYSRLWGNPDGSIQYATDSEAKAARDRNYREHKRMGHKCRRWVLKNQMRDYAGLGSPLGKYCDVYMLDVEEN